MQVRKLKPRLKALKQLCLRSQHRGETMCPLLKVPLIANEIFFPLSLREVPCLACHRWFRLARAARDSETFVGRSV